jgi:ABC-type uncharacterized transport system YnjBCD ATPase subunit
MIQTRPSNVGFLGCKGKARRDKKKHTTIEISIDNQTNGDTDGLEGKQRARVRRIEASPKQQVNK